MAKEVGKWIKARQQYLVVYLRRSGADPQLSPWLEGRNHLHPVVHRLRHDRERS
jgi:hypothetical protein